MNPRKEGNPMAGFSGETGGAIHPSFGAIRVAGKNRWHMISLNNTETTKP